MPTPIEHERYPLSASSKGEVNGRNPGGRYYDTLHSSIEGRCGGSSTDREGILRRG